MEFDEKRWTQLIKEPGWYMGEVGDFIVSLGSQELDEGPEKDTRNRIRKYFAEKLATGEVTLGSGQTNMDTERAVIDTVVIHHTSSTQSYTLDYLNSVHLLNIYLPYFRDPRLDSEKHLKGKPLESGHFYKGKQVFWGYHWFIDASGNAKRLLEDAHIGWHSGNWDTNRRSVGICLDGNFMNNKPKEAQLTALSEIISKYYSFIKNEKIIGHKDVNPRTECPGNTFSKWREKGVKT